MGNNFTRTARTRAKWRSRGAKRLGNPDLEDESMDCWRDFVAIVILPGLLLFGCVINSPRDQTVDDSLSVPDDSLPSPKAVVRMQSPPAGATAIESTTQGR